MTTIAYANGIMAADSRAYSGGRTPIGSKVKMRRLEDGTLLGGSSSVVGGTEAVLEWYIAGATPNVDGIFFPDSFNLLVAKPNGEVFFANNQPALSGPLKPEYIATGSGEEFAYGAMYMGANPLQAIQAACHLDPYSGLPIYAASHAGPMPKLRLDLSPEHVIWLGE